MKSNSNYLFFKSGILMLLLVLSSMSFAQTKVEQIEELLSTYAAYGRFNGSVLVSDQGKVI